MKHTAQFLATYRWHRCGFCGSILSGSIKDWLCLLQWGVARWFTWANEIWVEVTRPFQEPVYDWPHPHLLPLPSDRQAWTELWQPGCLRDYSQSPPAGAVRCSDVEGLSWWHNLDHPKSYNNYSCVLKEWGHEHYWYLQIISSLWLNTEKLGLIREK